MKIGRKDLFAAQAQLGYARRNISRARYAYLRSDETFAVMGLDDIANQLDRVIRALDSFHGLKIAQSRASELSS